MTQFYSRVDTTLNGDVYSIPFSYIKEEEIQVYIGDELYTDWYFLNDSQIKINNLPSDLPSNTIVSVRRLTDISKKEVEYTNNTLLNKENLNLSQDQLLHAVQEIYDNNIQFEIDTLKVIQENKEEVLDTVQENKEEVLGIQQAFEDEVNHKIQEVSEAASKINALEEAVDTAVTAANTATEQASIATDTTQEIIAANEELKDAMDKTVEEINDKITNFNTSLEEKTVELTQEADRQINNIQSTGFYMRDDKLYFINSNGEEEEFKSGGAGAVMFDTKIADHILQGEEAKGWALQGTYVTKESYPDFYNKCLEEYKDSTINNTESWTQPILSANGTLGGDTFAVSASSEYNSSSYAYNAFDGNTGSEWISNQEGSLTVPDYIIFYNPKALNVKKITLTNRIGKNTYATVGNVYGSNENGNYVLISSFTNTVSGKNVSWNVDLSSNLNFYKYYKVEFTQVTFESSTSGMGITEVEIVATQASVNIAQNLNGHKFYPISEKSSIDKIYNQYGIADFYGIDEVNERVFLPRNKYFHQLTDDVSKVNEMIEAGLPNIDGQNTGMVYNSNPPTGAFTKTDTVGAIDGSSLVLRYVNFDASSSSSIYGNSDTVQPPASLKLLYYCVGNTEITQAITNITEITTSENDTIPLFSGMYFDFKPNNASWLKAGVQQNSAGIYKTCYETLVEIVSGVNNYDLKVINQAEMLVDVNYDEYWILDQDNLTFRTPLTIATKSLSGGVAGNGMALGLTDGINYTSLNKTSSDVLVTGNQYGQIVGATTTINTSNQMKAQGITTDPTKSGIIAEQSNAQLYFKVANAVQKLELLDAGEVLEGLANKADLDLKNTKPSQEFITQAVSWGMPDYKNSISVTLPYVAPCDGVMWISAPVGTNKYFGVTIFIEEKETDTLIVNTNSGSSYGSNSALVPKGATLKAGYGSGGSVKFIPLKGAN